MSGVVTGWMRAAVTAVAIALALAAAPGRAAAQSIALPVEIQNGGVRVRAEAGMDRLAARIARTAHASLEEIAEDLPGLPRPRSIEIRLVKRAENLSRAAPPGRGAPPWAIGVAYPDAGVVVAAYRRGALPSDIDSVVIHELAHLALGAALGPKAPRWLHEGFAYIHSSDFSLDRTRTLTGMAWTGDVIPLADLDRSFPAEENAAARAYAQSYDFVSFLAKRGRYSGPEDDGNRWPFRQLLVDLAGGKTLDQAAREEFSSTLKQLFGEWQNSLRDRYLTVPVSVLGAAVWVLCALLLVVGFVRKRRQGRRTLARWAVEEAGQPDEVLSDDELAAADGVDPDGRDDAAPEVVTSEGSAPHDPSVADPPGAERPADADQPVAVDPPRRRHGRDPGDLPN